jgi:hypothetical protein
VSQQINLFNPVFLAQKKVFSARTMAIGAGIVLAALAALHGAQRVQLAMQERQLADADKQFKDAQQQLAMFAAAKKPSPGKTLEDEATRLEERLVSQQKLLESFSKGSLGSLEGFARYLTALARQTVAGVWITGFTIDGSDGLKQLRGRLQQPELLPTYLRKLHQEEVFRGQAFTEFHMNRLNEAGGSASRSSPAQSPDASSAEAIEFVLGPASMRSQK